MQTLAAIPSSTVFMKTPKGHDEIARRGAGLNARQRRVLIVMDGNRDIDMLTAMIPRQELEDIIPFLARQSFIAPAAAPAAQQNKPELPQAPAPVNTAGEAATADPVTLRQVKDFMTTTAQTYLGLLAADVIQRIERAKDARQLLSVVGHWHMALRESRQGGRFAEPYLEQVKAVLLGSRDTLASAE